MAAGVYDFGDINWFNSKCRMGGAVAKVVRDTLKEKVGIQTLTCEMDMMDASPTLEAKLKEEIEGFLEIL